MDDLKLVYMTYRGTLPKLNFNVEFYYEAFGFEDSKYLCNDLLKRLILGVSLY